MSPIRTAIAAGLAALLLPAFASASTVIAQFSRTTNDGVYSLSDAQARALGHADAGFIGFYRVREGGGTTFEMGDVFDETTVRNSVKTNEGGILAILNGRADGLSYRGKAFQRLGATTIGTTDAQFYEAVALLFGASSGSIVFNRRGGTTSFNASQSRGAFEVSASELAYLSQPPVAAVPVPAALGLLAFGLGTLGMLGVRRRRAAAA